MTKEQLTAQIQKECHTALDSLRSLLTSLSIGRAVIVKKLK